MTNPEVRKAVVRVKSVTSRGQTYWQWKAILDERMNSTDLKVYPDHDAAVTAANTFLTTYFPAYEITFEDV